MTVHYFCSVLSSCWSRSRGSFFHLVFNQKKLEHRIEVLIDGLFYSLLQQVPLGLNLRVLLPLHCVHRCLQKAQANQHRALVGRKRGGQCQIRCLVHLRVSQRLNGHFLKAVTGRY